MEETKRCPYCGEEILAIAKKCKHCGEWLEEKHSQMSTTTPETELEGKTTDEETVSIDEEKFFSKNIPLSNTAIRCLYWVAIIGLLIITAHGLIPDGEVLNTSTSHGKIWLIKEVLNFLCIIPEWIGDVLMTFGVIALLLTVKQAMANMQQSFDKLFEWLIFAIGASTALSIIGDFIDDEFANALTGYVFIFVILYIISDIIQIILGIKISKVYTGSINYLGKVMYICGGIQLLSFVIGVVVGASSFADNEDVFYWSTLAFTMVNAFVLYFYYSVLKGTLIQSEEE